MLGSCVLNIEVEEKRKVEEYLDVFLCNGEYYKMTYNKDSKNYYLLVVIEVCVSSLSVEEYQKAAIGKSSELLAGIGFARPLIRDLYILSPVIK